MKIETKLFVFLSLAIASPAANAESSNATPPPSAGIDPYYTGPLLAPGPAVPAGLLAIEPYLIYDIMPGSYDVNGNAKPSSNHISEFQSVTLIKYGITNELSIQAYPTTTSNFDQHGGDSGDTLADTAVDLNYLLTPQDKKTGKPSITASVGMYFPTGRYQRLGEALDASGTGTFQARLGVVAQSLLFGQSEHPLRVRVYGYGYVPLSDVGLHGLSSYGTDFAFNGGGRLGASGNTGVGLEYSLTQKWVLAFDAYYGFGFSSHVNGFELNGTQTHFSTGSYDTTQIAPAIEYNFSQNFGIIGGAVVSVAGHNTSQVVEPAIAFNFVFF